MSKFLKVQPSTKLVEREKLNFESFSEQMAALENLYMKEKRANQFLLKLIAEAAAEEDMTKIMEFVQGKITAMYQDAA